LFISLLYVVLLAKSKWTIYVINKCISFIDNRVARR
jgi:hypothetical protein